MKGNSSSGGGVFTATMIGMAVGLAIGFLYAPQSGAESRAMVKDRFEEMKERAVHLRDRWRHAAQNVGEDVKQAAQETSAELRSSTQEFKSTMHNTGPSE